jgi:hypothetical protein
VGDTNWKKEELLLIMPMGLIREVEKSCNIPEEDRTKETNSNWNQSGGNQSVNDITLLREFPPMGLVRDY